MQNLTSPRAPKTAEENSLVVSLGLGLEMGSWARFQGLGFRGWVLECRAWGLGSEWL